MSCAWSKSYTFLVKSARFRSSQMNTSAAATEDGLNFYDSRHRFEHSQLLLVLLHSLPYASRGLQSRALQVMLSCFLSFCVRVCMCEYLSNENLVV